MPKKLHHVGIVTDNMEQLLSLWQNTLGLPIIKTEHNDDEAVDIAFLGIGDSAIEIIVPTTEDSGIAKHMAKKGTGQHHICIEVDDIQSVMDKLREDGFELIDDVPKTRHDGTLYAFTHPKSTGGTMIELYEVSK